ncbi:MAG: hypothetical protein AMXMBFR82_40040 [Candidatus Hydrogenedentota bacterium]
MVMAAPVSMSVAMPATLPTAFAVVMALVAVVTGAGMPALFRIAVEVFAVAGRTGFRTRRAAGHGKAVVAFRTNEMTIAFHGDTSPFDSHRQPLDQGLRYFAPRPRDEPAKGRPRHIDLFRGFPVVQPFQIPQAKGFQLIQTQHHLIEVPQGNPCGFEDPGGWICADPTAFVRSSHVD